MVMDARDVQPENALFPKNVTEFGMATDARDVQPENA